MQPEKRTLASEDITVELVSRRPLPETGARQPSVGDGCSDQDPVDVVVWIYDGDEHRDDPGS
jgi:hypothetical protein